MGNPKTPGGAGHYSVQIVDDGSGTDAGAVRGGGSGPDAAAVRSGGAPSAPVWQRVNLALVAAWSLVGAFLAVGLWWVVSSYPMPQMYYDPTGTNQLTPASSKIVMNLYQMGPEILLFGIMGAFTLLVMQGVRFRRGKAIW
ncbi:hypothetical protein [Arthrobacter koreensis]|uniref:hypothetical protein n=1 Tax=Arthrobacter koreensis TaxID=199136 RepID=UPI002DB9C9D9|nr:hypothetical protein [Arthrobacter koreensis]MEB7503956.1 hypothetical protein [Arthrobacter koreensis]